MEKVRLQDYKKEMRNYYKQVVDKEEDETFTSWFSALLSALKEEGKVVREGNQTFVIE